MLISGDLHSNSTQPLTAQTRANAYQHSRDWAAAANAMKRHIAFTNSSATGYLVALGTAITAERALPAHTCTITLK